MFNEKSEQFKNTKVTSELVVDVQPKEISIALLEDKALVEFQKEGRSASFNETLVVAPEGFHGSVWFINLFNSVLFSHKSPF